MLGIDHLDSQPQNQAVAERSRALPGALPGPRDGSTGRNLTNHKGTQ